MMKNLKQLIKLTSVCLMLSFSTLVTPLTGTNYIYSVAETEKTLTRDGNFLRLSVPVSFEPGSDTLKPETEDILGLVVEYLNDKTYISHLRIEGHSVEDENSDKNLELSLKRSQIIAAFIASKGIDCKRLVVVGFGDTKPVADNSTQEGKELNTRIEFVNAGMRGKPIGGFPFDGGGLEIKDFCGDKK